MKSLKNILPAFTILFFIVGCSDKDKSVSVLPQNIGLMQQTAKALDNIPLNYRAFPIKIDEATANAVRTCALCTPKYKADILTMLDIKLKDGQRKKAVATVLQDVKYNSHFEINGQNYLTLLLTSVEAQYMSLLDKNPLKILLRSFKDGNMLPLEIVDESSFEKRWDYYEPDHYTSDKEYLLKINADTARNIENGDIVNIKIKGMDNLLAKSVKILESFSLNGDSFVSFNLTPIEAQYLFFAEADKKKIYLSKSLNKEILEWISPAQENVKAALALAEEYIIIEDKLGAADAVSFLRKKYGFTSEEWSDFYKQASFMGLFDKVGEKIAADNKNSAFPSTIPLPVSEPAAEGLFEKAETTASKSTEILDKGENTVMKEARQVSSIERFKIGLRYYNQEDYNKAKEEWEAALELDPNNTDAFFGLKRIEARTSI